MITIYYKIQDTTTDLSTYVLGRVDDSLLLRLMLPLLRHEDHFPYVDVPDRGEVHSVNDVGWQVASLGP